MTDPTVPGPDVAEEFVIVGEWLAHRIDGCTCGTGNLIYGHERGCGLEPLAKVADLLDAEAERDAALAAVQRVRALHVARGRNILGQRVCAECSPLQPVPCPTIRALDGEG